MEMRPKDGAASQGLLDIPEGDVPLIFSEQVSVRMWLQPARLTRL
jgi:hypothetical protein